MKSLTSCLIFFSLSHFIFAEKEFSVPDQLDSSVLEGITSQSLPSPGEIMSIAKRHGLKIETRKGFGLFNEEINDLAGLSQIEAVFILGRMFSIAGLSYEELNNQNILLMAEKLFNGVSAIDLPTPMKNEIKHQYNSFLKQPDMNRKQLIYAFTNSRSTLMEMLNNNKLPEKDQHELKALAICLEFGLWLQSLSLALETEKSEDHLNAIVEIFMIRDLLTYFDSTLKKILSSRPKSPFLNTLLSINKELQKAAQDQKFTPHEKELVQRKLRLVLF